jgi:hypothetical protein
VIVGVLRAAGVVLWLSVGCSGRPLGTDELGDASQAGACTPSSFRCVDATHSQMCAPGGTWEPSALCRFRCDPRPPGQRAQQVCQWNPSTASYDKDCTFTRCCGGLNEDCCAGGTCQASLTCQKGSCT